MQKQIKADRPSLVLQKKVVVKFEDGKPKEQKGIVYKTSTSTEDTSG